MINHVLFFQFVKSNDQEEMEASNNDFQENRENFEKTFCQVLKDHPDHLKRLEDILIEADANGVI